MNKCHDYRVEDDADHYEALEYRGGNESVGSFSAFILRRLHEEFKLHSDHETLDLNPLLLLACKPEITS